MRSQGCVTGLTCEWPSCAALRLTCYALQRIVNVNLARAPKAAIGNGNRPVWEDEEWIKEHGAPLEGEQADDAPAPEGP